MYIISLLVPQYVLLSSVRNNYHCMVHIVEYSSGYKISSSSYNWCEQYLFNSNQPEYKHYVIGLLIAVSLLESDQLISNPTDYAHKLQSLCIIFF